MKVQMVRCRIERGAFSGERLFRVQHRNGVIHGGGHPIYFRDRNRRPLNKDAPPREEVIDGFVHCRVLRKADGELIIELPGSEVLTVDDDQIVEIEDPLSTP
jgi:hypothetical protein